jgi:hypothetical protein
MGGMGGRFNALLASGRKKIITIAHRETIEVLMATCSLSQRVVMVLPHQGRSAGKR